MERPPDLVDNISKSRLLGGGNDAIEVRDYNHKRHCGLAKSSSSFHHVKIREVEFDHGFGTLQEQRLRRLTRVSPDPKRYRASFASQEILNMSGNNLGESPHLLGLPNEILEAIIGYLIPREQERRWDQAGPPKEKNKMIFDNWKSRVAGIRLVNRRFAALKGPKQALFHTYAWLSTL